MPQYLLLLRDDPSRFAEVSPEEMQAIIERYKVWSTTVRETGCYERGNKLRDGEGRMLVPGASGVSVNDGPYPETKEVVGGYYLFNAESYEQVAELAKSCPHLAFGSIEIREIEPV